MNIPYLLCRHIFLDNQQTPSPKELTQAWVTLLRQTKFDPPDHTVDADLLETEHP